MEIDAGTPMTLVVIKVAKKLFVGTMRPGIVLMAIDAGFSMILLL